MAATVQDLIDQVRQMTATTNNQVVTDDELAGYLSDAVKVLFDIFLADGAKNHWFFKTFPFSLVGGVGNNAVDLPSDFQNDLCLNLNPASATPTTVPGLATLNERNNLAPWGNFNPIAPGVQTNRRYVLTGNQLQVLPVLSAAGDYELWYQAQIPDLAVPHTRSWAISPDDVPLDAGDGNSGFNFENANFDPERDVGSTFTVNFDAPNTGFNGQYTISGIHPGSTTWCFVEGGVSPIGFTSPAAGPDVVETYQPENSVSVLPQVLNPWQLFLKVHASISVLAKRDINNPAFQQKLDQEHARAVQMAQVRKSDLRQGPLTRDSNNGFFNGFFGGVAF